MDQFIILYIIGIRIIGIIPATIIISICWIYFTNAKKEVKDLMRLGSLLRIIIPIPFLILYIFAKIRLQKETI